MIFPALSKATLFLAWLGWWLVTGTWRGMHTWWAGAAGGGRGGRGGEIHFLSIKKIPKNGRRRAFILYSEISTSVLLTWKMCLVPLTCYFSCSTIIYCLFPEASTPPNGFDFTLSCWTFKNVEWSRSNNGPILCLLHVSSLAYGALWLSRHEVRNVMSVLSTGLVFYVPSQLNFSPSGFIPAASTSWQSDESEWSSSVVPQINRVNHCEFCRYQRSAQRGCTCTWTFKYRRTFFDWSQLELRIKSNL